MKVPTLVITAAASRQTSPTVGLDNMSHGNRHNRSDYLQDSQVVNQIPESSSDEEQSDFNDFSYQTTPVQHRYQNSTYQNWSTPISSSFITPQAQQYYNLDSNYFPRVPFPSSDVATTTPPQIYPRSNDASDDIEDAMNRMSIQYDWEDDTASIDTPTPASATNNTTYKPFGSSTGLEVAASRGHYRTPTLSIDPAILNSIPTSGQTQPDNTPKTVPNILPQTQDNQYVEPEDEDSYTEEPSMMSIDSILTIDNSKKSTEKELVKEPVVELKRNVNLETKELPKIPIQPQTHETDKITESLNKKALQFNNFTKPLPAVPDSRPISPIPVIKPKNDLEIGKSIQKTENNGIDSDLKDFYDQFNSLKISQSTLAPSSAPSTLLVLSPASYDHVFSRDWVSKSFKSSVVERPQRLMATAIGLGAAISLHSYRRKYYKSKDTPTESDGIGFSILSSKRRVDIRTSPHVAKIHGPGWGKKLYEICKKIDDKHSKEDVEVPKEWPYNDIYMNKGTIRALEGVVGAVQNGVDGLFQSTQPLGKSPHDRAFVALRPPGHHSRKCSPSGFCLINNVHIAIQYAAEKHGVTHALVFDFDLHHGDGTQDICWKLAGLEEDDDEPATKVNEQVDDISKEDDDLNSSSDAHKVSSKHDTKYTPPKLGYFSLHDINSFPTETGYASASQIRDASVCVKAHGICVWNIHLEKFSDEAAFMKLYDEKYRLIFEKAREYLDEAREAHFRDEINKVEEAKAKLKIEMAALEKLRKERLRNNKKKNLPDSKRYPTFPDRFPDISTIGGAEQEEIPKPTTKIPEIKPFQPFIVISAGFDASENETISMRRHGVYVPTSFYTRFTEDVLDLAADYKCSTTYEDYKLSHLRFAQKEARKGNKKYDRSQATKVLSLMEGGYSDGALSTGVFSHVSALLDTELVNSQLVSDPAKNEYVLTQAHLFNSFITYHFEQACKLRWNPKSVYSVPPAKKGGEAAQWAKNNCLFVKPGGPEVKNGVNVKVKTTSATKEPPLPRTPKKGKKSTPKELLNPNGKIGDLNLLDPFPDTNPNENRTKDIDLKTVDSGVKVVVENNDENGEALSPAIAFLTWLESGLSLGRSLWPEYVRQASTIAELEKLLQLQGDQ